MKRAAEHRSWWLKAAQDAAKALAGLRGSAITMDDIFTYTPILPSQLGNAAGSVFRGEEWEFAGFVKSTRPSNHARILRSWRLK